MNFADRGFTAKKLINVFVILLNTVDKTFAVRFDGDHIKLPKSTTEDNFNLGEVVSKTISSDFGRPTRNVEGILRDCGCMIYMHGGKKKRNLFVLVQMNTKQWSTLFWPKPEMYFTEVRTSPPGTQFAFAIQIEKYINSHVCISRTLCKKTPCLFEEYLDENVRYALRCCIRTLGSDKYLELILRQYYVMSGMSASFQIVDSDEEN
jgi:hypothetical protein